MIAETFAQVGPLLAVWLLPVLFAITIHEAAHGWAADWLGDDTARRRGRVTLNPLRHVDPVGTLVVPALMLITSTMLAGIPLVLGWAKPVPVAFHRLSDPKRDMVLVAIAGPAVNIAMALASAIGLRVIGTGAEMPILSWIAQNLENAIFINVALACINMIPVPPLDGGRILTGLLPIRLAIPFARLEPYGLFVLIGLIFVLPPASHALGYDLDFLDSVVMPTIDGVFAAIVWVAWL